MCPRSAYEVSVTQWRNIDGSGSVCFEADGSVKLVVSDEVAEVVAAAEASGITADELINCMIDDAEASAERLGVADGTGPIVRMVPPVWSPDFS